MLAAAVLAVAVAVEAGSGRELPGEGHSQTPDGDQARASRTVSTRQTLATSLAPQKGLLEQCNWAMPATTIAHEQHDDAMMDDDDDATKRNGDDAIRRTQSLTLRKRFGMANFKAQCATTTRFQETQSGGIERS